jgi:hypothetical protein
MNNFKVQDWKKWIFPSLIDLLWEISKIEKYFNIKIYF